MRLHGVQWDITDILQVRTFLNLLPSSEADTDKFALNQPLEVGGSLNTLNTRTLMYRVVFYHRSLVCSVCWHGG